MDIKRLGRLFQLRKQANGLGQQVGGGGGNLSATSGYTTGANAANQSAQMPQPPDNMTAIRGIQEREKAYFSNLDRGKFRKPTPTPTPPVATPGAAPAANAAAPAAPQSPAAPAAPQAPSAPVSDAQRAMDDLKAGFNQAGKAGPTGPPPPPKSPDVIPTNPQTGVPDRYYSLASGETPAWAKPENPTPAPKMSPQLTAELAASDAAKAAPAPAPAPTGPSSADIQALSGKSSPKSPLTDEDEPAKPAATVAQKPMSASAADAVNMLQVGMGGPADAPAQAPKAAPYASPKASIRGNIAGDMPQPEVTVSSSQMNENQRQRELDTQQEAAAKAKTQRPYAPKDFRGGYDLSGLQGDKAKPGAFQVFDRPAKSNPPTPVALQQANRTAAALSSPSTPKSPQMVKRPSATPATPASLPPKVGSFMRESQIKAIMQDISIPATCLLVLCLDEWGTDMLDWEPETLEQAARMSWNAELPQANKDKIWALITHMTTDAFYSSLEGFIHICNALSGHGVDFEQFDPAEVDEMCWGVTEAFLIAPMEKEERFNEEIVAYMEARLEYEGFQKVPHMLKKFVQIPAREEELNQTLTSDGIGFKNYWKMQEGRLANIDIWVKERLAALFTILENLPLRYANEQGLKRICERARLALGSQQALKQEVMAASR